MTYFNPAQSIHAVRVEASHVTFDLTLPGYPPLHALQLTLTGAHQAENASLALAAAHLFLNDIGRTLDQSAIRHALAHITMPGRLEQLMWRGTQIILDGAHNPQKMHALCDALVAIYPDQRFVFVFALKQGKDHIAVLAQILPLAAHIVLTGFDNQDQGMPISTTDPHDLAVMLARDSVEVSVVPDAGEALSAAVTIAQTASSESISMPVVVTGSLYLLAEVYDVIDRPSTNEPSKA